jgi:predicted nucleic acid-binding protein
MIWSEQTQQEAFLIVGKIPPLSWEVIAGLFRSEDGYTGALFPERFQHIADKSDIKFAALSDATGAPLITMDKGLLGIRETLAVPILMPFEFLALQKAVEQQSFDCD